MPQPDHSMDVEGESPLMMYLRHVLMDVNFNQYIARALEIQQESLIRRFVAAFIEKASAGKNNTDMHDSSQETIMYEPPSSCPEITPCTIHLNVLSAYDYERHL